MSDWRRSTLFAKWWLADWLIDWSRATNQYVLRIVCTWERRNKTGRRVILIWDFSSVRPSVQSWYCVEMYYIVKLFTPSAFISTVESKRRVTCTLNGDVIISTRTSISNKNCVFRPSPCRIYCYSGPSALRPLAVAQLIIYLLIYLLWIVQCTHETAEFFLIFEKKILSFAPPPQLRSTGYHCLLQRAFGF